MKRSILKAVLLGTFGPLLTGALLAQAIGGPGDYDLKLIPDKKILRQGDQVTVDAAVTVRKLGVLGWEYGVEHDENVLDLLSATTDGSDTPSVYFNGFDETTIIKNDSNVNIGWISAIVLTLGRDRKELPISPKFVMAKAVYQARSGICGAQSSIPSQITWSSKLAVPQSPVVEVSLTVETTSVEPTIQDPADVSIDCPAAATLDLKLVSQSAEDRKLIADGKDKLPIKILLQNATAGIAAEVQGWSYGLKIDPTLLEVTDLTSGPDALALNGGAGPDFRAYNFSPLEQSGDGQVKGITVGVVISLDPPNDVLTIPAGGSKHLETATVRSVVNIPTGQPDRTAEFAFVSEVLGGDRPVENIITAGGLSATPRSDTPVSLALAVTAPSLKKQFRRGFANPDDRYDIADGIWTIRVVYFQDGHFDCKEAADANDDGRIDLSDAIYTFDYLLQPGKTTGSTPFTKPPPPYPGCGVDPTDDVLGCDQSTHGCN